MSSPEAVSRHPGPPGETRGASSAAVNPFKWKRGRKAHRPSQPCDRIRSRNTNGSFLLLFVSHANGYYYLVRRCGRQPSRQGRRYIRHLVCIQCRRVALGRHRLPPLSGAVGTALLAYSFGLRHAVDADHIAAIDNVTRKLMQDGKRPVAVGFMFSLGHSTIVVLGSAAIAGAALALQHRFDVFRDIAGVIGTLVSAFFLFAIAIVNLIVLQSVYRTFVRVRSGEPYVEEDLNLLLAGRGILARVFRPIFRIINRSWHMFPLGMLLGWDLTLRPRLACWAFPPLRPPRAYRSGRSSCFQFFLRLGCRSSTRPTTS